MTAARFTMVARFYECQTASVLSAVLPSQNKGLIDTNPSIYGPQTKSHRRLSSCDVESVVN